MKIKNHLLVPEDGENLTISKSPNQSAPLTPLLLVMHYTANNSLDETVSWFMNPDAQASSHLVIGRDGRIVQMVPFNKKAWHAGASSWGNLDGINRYSIGIELVNAGKLRRRSDGKWVNWAGRAVPDEEVTEAVHRAESAPAGWHEYTEVQIESAINVSLLLNSAYHFTDVLGHEDISPGRKVDPGPLFPLNSFRSRVLGRA